MGAFDSYNGLIAPAIRKINDAFKVEWETKTSPVGAAVTPAQIKQGEAFNPTDSTPALGNFLNKGWKPDFTRNTKNLGFLNDAIAKLTHNGNLITEVENIAIGPKSKAVFAEAIQLYTDYYNAYYNSVADSNLKEPENNRYLSYLNNYRIYLEGFIGKLNDLAVARAKDLTQGTSTPAYSSTRHQEILNQFHQAVVAESKRLNAVIADPKSTDKEKNSAMGSLDSHNGLVVPFSKKVDDIFKAEWDAKEVKVHPTAATSP